MEYQVVVAIAQQVRALQARIDVLLESMLADAPRDAARDEPALIWQAVPYNDAQDPDAGEYYGRRVGPFDIQVYEVRGIGWKIQLACTRCGEVLEECDEMFDTAEAARWGSYEALSDWFGYWLALADGQDATLVEQGVQDAGSS